jgi:hypothetical protein
MEKLNRNEIFKDLLEILKIIISFELIKKSYCEDRTIYFNENDYLNNSNKIMKMNDDIEQLKIISEYLRYYLNLNIEIFEKIINNRIEKFLEPCKNGNPNDILGLILYTVSSKKYIKKYEKYLNEYE